MERVASAIPFEGRDWPLHCLPQVPIPGDTPVLRLTEANWNLPIASWSGSVVRVHLDLFREIGRWLRGDMVRVSEEMARRSPVTIQPPAVDGFERVLAHLILLSSHISPPPPKPVHWPHRAPFAVVLTHDVDRTRKTFQYITHAYRKALRLDADGVSAEWRTFRNRIQGREPYWTFNDILRIESVRNLRSVFFFLNETKKPSLNPRSWKLFLGRYRVDAPEIALLIRTLVDQGWEVGVHGSYNSASDPQLLRMERSVLESISGRRIRGVRQHYFRLEGDTTWQLQDAAGFLYDASVGSSRVPGFVRGTCFPFSPWPASSYKPLGLLEIPTTVMDGALMYESMKSLRRREDPDKVLKRVVELVDHCGGVLNALWHSHVFSERDFPDGAALYEGLLDLCAERGAWFTTGEELSHWWRNYRTLPDGSQPSHD